MADPAASDTGFDLDSSVSTIANGLGLDISEPDSPEPEDASDAPAEEPALSADPPADAPAPRAPPKSWAKEQYELWSKLPPEAQDYYEKREKDFLNGLEQYKGEATYGKQLRDILAPYKPILAAQGVSETDAVQYLLNAHYKLTQGSPEERAAAYRQIGIDLGFAQDESAEVTDPALKQMQQKVRELESNLTARQQREYSEARSKADSETNAFAADPANAYFNEVAQDMLPFVKQGLSLKDAYDKAVWANPVTREKEIARRQTEADAKLKEKAKTEADAARRATSTNVRGSQTPKAPTEPKGSMEDTMRDTLKKIKDRAH